MIFCNLCETYHCRLCHVEVVDMVWSIMNNKNLENDPFTVFLLFRYSVFFRYIVSVYEWNCWYYMKLKDKNLENDPFTVFFQMQMKTLCRSSKTPKYFLMTCMETSIINYVIL